MYRILVSCLVIAVLLSISCSSSDGGGDPNANLQSGTYQINESGSGCDDSWTDSYQIPITISGDTVTVNIDGDTYSGSITGGTFSFTSLPDPWFEDGGTVTVTSASGTVNSDTSFTMNVNWSWTDGDETCGGSMTLNGSRVT